MKTNKISVILTAMVLALSVGLTTSCRKDKKTEEEVDRDTSEAEDNGSSETITNDISNIGSQACESTNGQLNTYKMNGTESVYAPLLACATVSADLAAKIVTVTFNGSQCLDGRTRSGSLIYDYSQSITSGTFTPTRYRHPGFKCVITSQNYVVDSYTVIINNKTVTNTTPVGFNPSATNLSWNVTSNLSIIKPSNGGTITSSINRTKTLLNTNDNTVYVNESTPIAWSKARIGITGSASGTTANGLNYSANIVSQLVKDFGTCTTSNNRRAHFIQGVLNFTPGNKPTRTIDYGNGACDNAATVTINGNFYNITLR